MSLSKLKTDCMNTQVLGYWNGIKERLKQNFPIVTDNDLHFREGKEKEMIEMLGHKLGKTKDELRNILVAL